MSQNYRLKLRLPTGAEMEAEGAQDFIEAQKDWFWTHLSLKERGEDAPEPSFAQGLQKPWTQIAEARKNGIMLLGKGKNSPAEACLILLGAARALLDQARPTAAQLAKCLRLSGYSVARIDRILQNSVKNNEIMPSGSRRSRCYELTQKGRNKSLYLAQELANIMTQT